VEGPAERAQTAETDVEADVGDRTVSRAKQEHRPLDTPPLQIAVRRLAKCRAEGADEVRFGHFGDVREAWDAERFGKRAVHRVTCAQHPAIALFDRSGHPLTLHAGDDPICAARLSHRLDVRSDARAA
jgi:hypothetical protein